MRAERCTWCGAGMDADAGFRAAEPAGERRAAFCRLEHVVPWALNGAVWEAGTIDEPAHVLESPTGCSHCSQALPDTRVMLIHHRGEHRIADAFCRVEHLLEWAKRGGRWA